MSTLVEPSKRQHEAIANAGERHLPADDPESVNHYRHLVAYHFALPFLAERRVLEFGCGTAYGLNLLLKRGGARRLAGCDLASAPLRYAGCAYGPDLGRRLVCGSAQLPFGSQCFDVVLAFQVIEHVPDDVGLLREARRVLVPGGLLIVTTPNVEASGGDPNHPDNPYHAREYSQHTLASACGEAGLLVERLFVHGSFRVGAGGLGAERWLAFRALRRLYRRLRSSRFASPVCFADFDVQARGADRALDLLFLCRRP